MQKRGERMTDKEIISKVHSSMYHRINKTGVAAPVDVLMDIGILSKKDYESWRFGRIPYLEAVCRANLRKLSFVMRQMRLYAQKNGLKPSETFYKRWGVKKPTGQGKPPVIHLRFSKSGDPNVEKWYATHFVDSKLAKAAAASRHNLNPETSSDQPNAREQFINGSEALD